MMGISLILPLRVSVNDYFNQKAIIDRKFLVAWFNYKLLETDFRLWDMRSWQ